MRSTRRWAEEKRPFKLKDYIDKVLLGLAGEQIHVFGRITALADVFDALLHRRVYKAAWDAGRTLAYIECNSGTQFDPHLVDILLQNSKEFLALNMKYPDDGAD
jgi:putative two-component system response regulator